MSGIESAPTAVFYKFVRGVDPKRPEIPANSFVLSIWRMPDLQLLDDASLKTDLQHASSVASGSSLQGAWAAACDEFKAKESLRLGAEIEEDLTDDTANAVGSRQNNAVSSRQTLQAAMTMVAEQCEDQGFSKAWFKPEFRLPSSSTTQTSRSSGRQRGPDPNQHLTRLDAGFRYCFVGGEGMGGSGQNATGTTAASATEGSTQPAEQVETLLSGFFSLIHPPNDDKDTSRILIAPNKISTVFEQDAARFWVNLQSWRAKKQLEFERAKERGERGPVDPDSMQVGD